MTVELPPFEWLLARVVITGILLALYAYDFLHVLDAWRDQRDWSEQASLRALIKSGILVFGIAVIFIGAVNAAFFLNDPVVRDALRFAGNVLLGVLLVGGIALVTSWEVGRRRSRRLGDRK